MRKPVQIGSRWFPGNAVRRDSAIGIFEEVNPLMTDTDVLVQRALLHREPARRTSALAHQLRWLLS